MRKFSKLICLLLCACLLACGASCRKPGKDSTGGDDGSLEGNINITIPITPQQRAVLQSVIDAYNEVNPLVNITITNCSTDQYKTLLQTQLANTDMNNVSFDICSNNVVSQYLTPEKFINFADYLSEENPYSDNQVWSDTLNDLAYKANGSNGEIYCLNMESTQVLFFYNTEIIAEAGVDPETEFDTWEHFLAACEKIKNNTDKTPLAIGGDAQSFYEFQMSWLIRAYTDQYFRDTIELGHTKEGDWNYDPKTDSAWSYKPNPSDYTGVSEEAAWENAYNIDGAGYNQNELRVLKAIQNDELGPVNKKYQNMIANLLGLRDYALEGFTGNSYETCYYKFFSQDAAIIISDMDFFNEIRKRANFPEVKTFMFPAMSANTKYPELAEYGPDSQFTRSLSGPVGYYGVVNKNSKQTEMVIDFLKFWTSLQGQEIAMSKRADLNEYFSNVSLVKNVTVPESIDVAKGIKINGAADNNPATLFARGLGNEPVTTNQFTKGMADLFGISNPTYKNISDYAEGMQTYIKSNMYRYLRDRGYISTCLEDVSANPFN